MNIRIAAFVRFLRTQHTFPFQAKILSFRAKPKVQSRMEQLGKLRHRRGGRRLSEWEVSESNLSILSLLQHIRSKILPNWIQSLNQGDFLRSRPLLQLRFSSNCVANVAIMLVINEFLALIPGSEPSFNTLSVLPSSPRQAICYADVKNRMASVRDDVNPEVVITHHRSAIKVQRCLDSSRHDKDSGR